MALLSAQGIRGFPQAAGDYLRALTSQIVVGRSARTILDLIIANRRAATGEPEGPALRMIERRGASDVKLMKWTVNGRPTGQ
jgi:hypothetical protein